jgi:hypothetical protein
VNSFRHGFWNEHRVVICAQRSAGIAAWKKEDAFFFSEQPPDCIGAQAPKGSQFFKRKMPFGERTMVETPSTALAFSALPFAKQISSYS